MKIENRRSLRYAIDLNSGMNFCDCLLEIYLSIFKLQKIENNFERIVIRIML